MINNQQQIDEAVERIANGERAESYSLTNAIMVDGHLHIVIECTLAGGEERHHFILIFHDQERASSFLKCIPLPWRS